ncbi:MAG TPA: nucleotide exchange factor GrpE [Verrucomicrobiae bacterium]|jgi:molecular chaperone GrpE (heat shock protein)|nr:nucleotide exchange factor GrpE [Verrucomicrobiae bacterium]
MSENQGRTPPLAPFILADVLFLGMAGVILALGHRPLLWWEACLIVACGAAAAWSLTAPFLRRDANEQTQTHSARLTSVAAELQKVEQLAGHLNAATLQWKTFEQQSAKSVELAQQLSESFTAETTGFREFLQKANDQERAHLRLEVEKLRRSEAEWLQTATRMLDHVYGLAIAAQRTGQRNLIDQINLFQESCRDAARRMGLLPVTPEPGQPFDARLHQLLENAAAPAEARVGDIIATGFTFQGHLVRRALVSLQTNGASDLSEQDELPMGQEAQP